MSKSARGFTLIELLIAISIIAVLATIGITSFGGAQARARDGQRKSDLKNIQTALRLYYNDHGAYPANTATNAITACGNAPACNTACSWDAAWVCGTTTYMTKLPGDPSTSTDYLYTKVDDDNYILQTCLENKSDPQAINEANASWCDSGKMFELRP